MRPLLGLIRNYGHIQSRYLVDLDSAERKRQQRLETTSSPKREAVTRAAYPFNVGNLPNTSHSEGIVPPAALAEHVTVAAISTLPLLAGCQLTGLDLTLRCLSDTSKGCRNQTRATRKIDGNFDGNSCLLS